MRTLSKKIETLIKALWNENAFATFGVADGRNDIALRHPIRSQKVRSLVRSSQGRSGENDQSAEEQRHHNK